MPRKKNIASKQKKSVPKRKSQPQQAVVKTPKRQVFNYAPLTKYACAINDPFCPHANGAKYMDGAKARTLTLPHRYRTSISSDANGFGSIIFCPGYDYFQATPTVITGSVMTFSTLAALAPIANVASYRIVSAGLILHKTVSPLSAGGMLRVRSFASISGNGLDSVDFRTYACDQSLDIPVSDSNEVAVVFKRVNDVLARTFVQTGATNPNSTITNWVSPGWGAIVVGVDGCTASTGILDIEVLINYELTFFDNNSMSLLATEPPPANVPAVATANVVSSELKSFAKRGVLEFGKYVVKTATKAAIGAVGARFGVPPLPITVD